MKLLKLNLILLLLAVSFGACKKTKDVDPVKKNEKKTETKGIEKETLEYTNTQNAIGFNFTSTGCPGCGSWGDPTFEKLGKDNSKFIPVTVHIKYGDPMITDESNALGNNRVGRKWTPQIYIGDIMSVVLSSGGGIIGSQSVAKMNSEITKKESETATALTSAKYKIIDKKVNVKYGAKFLADATGEYFVSTLLMENGIVYRQAGATSDFIHNHTIRKSTNGVWGKAVPMEKLVKEGTIEFTHSFDIDDKYKTDNLYAITILWKKDGSKYKYVNASKGIKL